MIPSSLTRLTPFGQTSALHSSCLKKVLLKHLEYIHFFGW